MTAPVVSVILPTFNRLAYLRPAVDSVLAQTLTDWELIIADDGSDAQTLEYLRSLQDPPRIRVLELPHSGNPSAVRNAALRMATGEYVAFLDSDDVWMPTKLQRQLESLRQHPDCPWGYTGYIRIDASGQVRSYPRTHARVPHKGAIFKELLEFEADVPTPAVLVERRIVERLGGFDEQQWVHEDYDLWLRIALEHPIDLIDEPLIALRTHEEHYSGTDRSNDLRLPSRYRQTCKMYGIVRDPQLRRFVSRLRSSTAVELANFYADFDRLAAARILLRGLVQSGPGQLHWRGWLWAAAKTLAPRSLLNAYRRNRVRGDSVRA